MSYFFILLHIYLFENILKLCLWFKIFLWFLLYQFKYFPFLYIFKENETVVENFDEIAEKMKSKDSKGINAIFQGFVAVLSKNYTTAIELCSKGLVICIIIINLKNVKIISLSRQYFFCNCMPINFMFYI